MKRLIALISLAALTLAGCATAPPEQTDKLALWREEARLDAEETPEELYAAALGEGMLVIYCTSTRMMDVAKSFEEHYRGLTVKVEHIREGDLYEQLTYSYESDGYYCDLIISSDGRGTIANEFVPRGVAVKYTPHDFKDKILPGNNDTLLMLSGEAGMLHYNDEYYSSPPINNWWELTEEKWRGMVYMPNPARSTTTLAFFVIMDKNSDIMARLYEDLYGESLQLSGGDTAGKVFVRRLMENGAHIVNSSDETAEIIGAPGSKSPLLGIMISSKIRLREIGYEMTTHNDMDSFCGVYTPISISIAGGAKNINTAKLFIRWLLGEADGQGEGYKPYLQSGAWSVRSDVRDDTGVRSEELNLLYPDGEYLYENYARFLTFWEELLENRSS